MLSLISAALTKVQLRVSLLQTCLHFFFFPVEIFENSFIYYWKYKPKGNKWQIRSFLLCFKDCVLNIYLFSPKLCCKEQIPLCGTRFCLSNIPCSVYLKEQNCVLLQCEKTLPVRHDCNEVFWVWLQESDIADRMYFPDLRVLLGSGFPIFLSVFT